VISTPRRSDTDPAPRPAARAAVVRWRSGDR